MNPFSPKPEQDEDLSGCLVKSGYLKPLKTGAVNSRISISVNNRITNKTEFDDEDNSDWLYQH